MSFLSVDLGEGQCSVPAWNSDDVGGKRHRARRGSGCFGGNQHPSELPQASYVRCCIYLFMPCCALVFCLCVLAVPLKKFLGHEQKEYMYYLLFIISLTKLVQKIIFFPDL